jgi:hypothetical protein
MGRYFGAASRWLGASPPFLSIPDLLLIANHDRYH